MRTACVLMICAMFLSGCGYRFGSTLPIDIRRVHVPTFINQCGEPLVEQDTTDAAIAEFHKDGTVKITSADTADAVLEVKLIDYTLEPIRYEKENVRSTSEYRMKIAADVVLKKKSGEVIVKRKVQGESTFIPSGDMSLSKRSALPLTARDLAHQIVESVTEAW